MEHTTRMENWNLRSYGSDYILDGRVFGHNRIRDGRKIHTSPVLHSVVTGEWIEFHTHNTIYSCPLGEVDPSCQLTKKYLLEQHPQHKEVWDSWLNNDPTRPPTPFARVDMPLEDGAFILALDAERPYLFVGMYQKWGDIYHWVIRSPFVNHGMYSDSVNLRTIDTPLPFDLRYFPEGENEVKFYCTRIDQGLKVFMVNVGQDPVFYQGIQLNPWHYLPLLHKEDPPIPPPPTPPTAPTPPDKDFSPLEGILDSSQEEKKIPELSLPDFPSGMLEPLGDESDGLKEVPLHQLSVQDLTHDTGGIPPLVLEHFPDVSSDYPQQLNISDED